MNMLLDELPETVEVDGMEYEINTDFRTVILFELMMQDADFPREQKPWQAIDLFYTDEVPHNIAKATDAIIWFYACGKPDRKKKENEAGESSAKRIYSFEHDDDYIYSAFMSQYRMDLNEIEYLHWWKFRSMFNSIKEDEKIAKIMEYRSIDITPKMSKEQKSFYRRAKEMYALPVSKSEEEKIDAIKEVLMNGGDLSGLL